MALTALLLFLWGLPPSATAQEPAEPAAPPADPGDAVDESVRTISELLFSAYTLLPKLLIAALMFLAAVLLAKALTWLLRRLLGRWERTEAIAALSRIACYLVATAAALSVIAGNSRALAGSVGLIGLALSWALQTPIESFTGWLLNSFRGYYRVGDRIAVGEVFGDVYRIDVLTTTVWEAGGPGKAVAGAQPTGAMITFPNWEVLRSNIVNYSREFPFLWDEVTVSVANESDLPYTMRVLEKTARRVIGDKMAAPVARYQHLLTQARLNFDIPSEPQVFVAPAESWTDCIVRFLVPARERRRWSTMLHVAFAQETARAEHHGKIIPAYPRREVLLRKNWNGEDVPVA